MRVLQVVLPTKSGGPKTRSELHTLRPTPHPPERISPPSWTRHLAYGLQARAGATRLEDMSNLSDTLKEVESELKEVESEFETEQKQRAEARTKKQEDQALLKRLTEEQWEVLHSELEAKANVENPNIHHARGMIQIGADTKLELRITRKAHEARRFAAILSSVSRDFPTKEIVLIPSMDSGTFQWSQDSESGAKSSAQLADILLKDLMKYHSLVLRAPQKSY